MASKNNYQASALNIKDSDKHVHPSYYSKGKIDLAFITEHKLSYEEFKGFCKGMTLKYLFRADKNKGIEDYKKAKIYLTWLVEKSKKMGMDCDIHRIDPSYYVEGGLPVIDIIGDKLSIDEYRGFCKGIILKYITRADMKNGLEDYVKAVYYLDRLVESFEEVEKSKSKPEDVDD